MNNYALTLAGPEAAEICRDKSGSGQDELLRELSHTPLARSEYGRPRGIRRIDEAHLIRFDGTDFCQWFGRRADGRWYPFGRIMQIVRIQSSAVLSEQPSVPQGWKLVPEEPTLEMLDALDPCSDYQTFMRDNYRAMLDVAPAPASRTVTEASEICPDCQGSGYSNHPDSGQICARCDGQGGWGP